VLIIAAELRDAADNDGVYSQNPADLCGRRSIRAITIGKILLA
jgi:hypothetical protein